MSAEPEPANAFANAIEHAGVLSLYEGLPHQRFEADLLAEELRTKPVVEKNGFPFYREQLVLREADATELSSLFAQNSTYRSFSGEKLCGGFHPDYAVEWKYQDNCLRVLICFGCQEVKLFMPGLESRNDLSEAAQPRLNRLLLKYRQNRPSGDRDPTGNRVGVIPRLTRKAVAAVSRLLGH